MPDLRLPSPSNSYGETNTLVTPGCAQDSRIDPHKLSSYIHQGAAGIAGIDGRIRLYEILIISYADIGPSCGAHDP